MLAVILILSLVPAALLLAGFVWTQREARRIEAAYPPVGALVPVSGGRLHLIDTGPADAPPERTLLLLHGASGNHRDMMLTIGAKLGGRYRIIAPDRPGHGASDRPGGRADASPARQGALIVEALDRIGVAGAIVVGHSWAGALATSLALEHPRLVRGLVLLAPVTHPWPGGVTWYYGVATTPVVGAVFTRAVVVPVASVSIDSAVGGVFAPQSAPPGYADAIAARLLLRPASFRANAEDVYDLLPFVERQSTRYEEIRVPTVVIAGDSDGVVSTSIHARAIVRQVAGAKLIVLAGTGHMPHHTSTDLVLQEIEEVAERAMMAAALRSRQLT